MSPNRSRFRRWFIEQLETRCTLDGDGMGVELYEMPVSQLDAQPEARAVAVAPATAQGGGPVAEELPPPEDDAYRALFGDGNVADLGNLNATRAWKRVADDLPNVMERWSKLPGGLLTLAELARRGTLEVSDALLREIELSRTAYAIYEGKILLNVFKNKGGVWPERVPFEILHDEPNYSEIRIGLENIGVLQEFDFIRSISPVPRPINFNTVMSQGDGSLNTDDLRGSGSIVGNVDLYSAPLAYSNADNDTMVRPIDSRNMDNYFTNPPQQLSANAATRDEQTSDKNSIADERAEVTVTFASMDGREISSIPEGQPFLVRGSVRMVSGAQVFAAFADVTTNSNLKVLANNKIALLLNWGNIDPTGNRITDLGGIIALSPDTHVELFFELVVVGTHAGSGDVQITNTSSRSNSSVLVWRYNSELPEAQVRFIGNQIQITSASVPTSHTPPMLPASPKLQPSSSKSEGRRSAAEIADDLQFASDPELLGEIASTFFSTSPTWYPTIADELYRRTLVIAPDTQATDGRAEDLVVDLEQHLQTLNP